MYLTQENCNKMEEEAAEKKAAAENAVAEKAATKKAEAEYGGVGHWLMTYPGYASPMYCL